MSREAAETQVWRERAEAAEARLAALREERDRLQQEREESVEWYAAVKYRARSEALEEALARVTAEREEARTSRDEFKALASVGTWHKDCRPNRHKAADEIQKSQQRIDTLAEALTHAREEIASLTDENVVLHNSCGKYEEEIARLTHMITERVDTDHGRCHAGLQAAEAARDEARAALQALREALQAHLTEADDPCEDRGVQWPCDVANALAGVDRPARPQEPV